MRSRKVDGAELRRVREAKGLSAPDLVALLLQDKTFTKTGKTVTDSMVRKIETGHRQPGPQLYAAINRALKLKGDPLLLSQCQERAA